MRFQLLVLAFVLTVVGGCKKSCKQVAVSEAGLGRAPAVLSAYERALARTGGKVCAVEGDRGQAVFDEAKATAV